MSDTNWMKDQFEEIRKVCNPENSYQTFRIFCNIYFHLTADQALYYESFFKWCYLVPWMADKSEDINDPKDKTYLRVDFGTSIFRF